MIQLPKNLIEMRLALSLTQAQMAKAIGCSLGSLRRYEQAGLCPTDRRVAYAEALAGVATAKVVEMRARIRALGV